ncbi:hypothetical protein [Candidatus Mycobacterium methanotrophicum]|uniref:Uncharacterized protein n=1 Tax=Candidatus Mycobacterium methanotrophicum TaxID=2943498 RepID=A0ABY4QL21_9MYCO|nr:hypothetical protein [Candidatus Mycobacterium methanotrophicum]UQX10536.1 hypothetical protein M5I08_21165 [Candidatus Mycobacterium methanotrophicum]
MHRFARDHGLPRGDFVTGQRKDDIAHEHLARFTGSEGVLFVGRRAGEDQAVSHRETPRRPR